MKKRATVFIALLIFATMVAPYAWAQGRDVTIVYSNNVNGQIYPAG